MNDEYSKVNPDFDYEEKGELSDRLVSEGKKPELSPNTDGSGYIKQINVDSRSSVVSPEENVLYLVRGVKWKWTAEEGWIRVGYEPQSRMQDGGRSTPVHVNTAPKVAPEKIFNGDVVFNGKVFLKGQELEPGSGGGSSENDARVWVGDYIGDETKFTSEMKVGDIIVNDSGFVGIIRHLNVGTEITVVGLEGNGTPTIYYFSDGDWSHEEVNTGTKLYRHFKHIVDSGTPSEIYIEYISTNASIEGYDEMSPLGAILFRKNYSDTKIVGYYNIQQNPLTYYGVGVVNGSPAVTSILIDEDFIEEDTDTVTPR